VPKSMALNIQTMEVLRKTEIAKIKKQDTATQYPEKPWIRIGK
jgi:hypothetical protein